MTDRPAVPVFLNAAAGTSVTFAHELRLRLGDQADVRIIQPSALAHELSDAVAGGHTIVGVAGGDGTLRAAAAILAGTRTALLCVPTGTLNNFARRIGIDDVAAAAGALRERRLEDVAIGTVGDSVFLNTLTLGEYSRVVRMREHHRRYLGKWPAAALGFLRASLSLRRLTVTLRTETRSFTRRTPFVWIGVGWGSFPRVHASLERRAEPDLEVAVLRSDSMRATLRFMARLAISMLRSTRPVRDSALEVLHTRAITLDARHRIDATADGEVLRLQPPVQVGVRDGALRVVLGSRTPAARADDQT